MARRPGKLRRGLRRLGARIRTNRGVIKVRSRLGRLGRKLRLPPRIKRAIKHKLRVVRGHCTLAADAVERALPGPLGRGYHHLRLLSPGHLGSFAAFKFQQDRKFLIGFGITYPIVSQLQVPAMIYIGVNPFAALLVSEFIGKPISLGILAWRQHHLRSDRSRTFADTVRGLGTEYQSYAHNERSHARKFMKQRAQRKQRVRSKQRAWQPNTLRHLGRELAMAPGR